MAHLSHESDNIQTDLFPFFLMLKENPCTDLLKMYLKIQAVLFAQFQFLSTRDPCD